MQKIAKLRLSNLYQYCNYLQIIRQICNISNIVAPSFRANYECIKNYTGKTLLEKLKSWMKVNELTFNLIQLPTAGE